MALKLWTVASSNHQSVFITMSNNLIECALDELNNIEFYISSQQLSQGMIGLKCATETLQAKIQRILIVIGRIINSIKAK